MLGGYFILPHPVDVHLYKIFSACRYIAQTASFKFRMGSPETARNEQVCAHQKSCRSKFSKTSLGFYARELRTYIAPIAFVFLCGVSWCYSRATNSKPRFWSFFLLLWRMIVSPIIYRFGCRFAIC